MLSIRTAVTIAIFLASHYSAGVMPEVIQNRQAGITAADLPEILPSVHGYVAVLDCERIGEVIWLAPIGEEFESFLITDCAMPFGTDGAAEWMVRYNVQVEVDYETALRWGTVGTIVKAEYRHDNARVGR